MTTKSLVLVLSLVIACLGGALCSELFAGKKGGSFLDAAKAAELKPARTRELRIVDEKGRTRALLDSDGLTILDADGKVCIMLTHVGPNRTGLNIANPQTKQQALLTARGLLVSDAKGEPSVWVEADGWGQRARPKAAVAIPTAAQRRHLLGPARRTAGLGVLNWIAAEERTDALNRIADTLDDIDSQLMLDSIRRP